MLLVLWLRFDEADDSSSLLIPLAESTPESTDAYVGEAYIRDSSTLCSFFLCGRFLDL